LLSKLPRNEKPEFKDYCLIMRVHPAADAAMIDAAYWHLAKRYAAIDDERSRKKLEELNEAYVVMGSADRRDAYLALRAQELGEDALPVPPPPPPEPLPLSVMERQKPRAREQSPEEEAAATARRRWYAAAISSAFAVPVVLGLVIAAYLAAAPPLFMLALIAVGALAIIGPFAPSIVRRVASLRPIGRLLQRSPRPASHEPEQEPPPNITPIDAAILRSVTRTRTSQLRARQPRNGRSAAAEKAEAPVEDPRD
jgi:hypothetical protein